MGLRGSLDGQTDVVSPYRVLHIVYPSLIVDPWRQGRLSQAPSSAALVPDADFRRLSLPALVLGLVLTALALAGPAAAASKSCADQVVADWYGDGRVDKVFPAHCYQEAIRSLPVDVLDYSNAKEDILRALAFARKGENDPGPTGGSQPTDNGPSDPVSTTTTDTTPEPPGTGHPGDEGGTGTDAADTVDTSGPSSVPIPLLILGGLALLLLAAGGAGYLSRRSQARRDGGPPGPA
jgi:hypothetical protein